jgi:hypothetical protein
MSNDQSLMDRIEFPEIPEAAMKKIAVLEEEFSRAEVEQCTLIEVVSIGVANPMESCHGSL